jgi:hypothetical protein
VVFHRSASSVSESVVCFDGSLYFHIHAIVVTEYREIAQKTTPKMMEYMGVIELDEFDCLRNIQ